ncbi:MAG: hypothetical protein IPQ07_19000 [Myxococcales bacterium]|nr:hypothetical protein [Myxococcales bacterium]
MIGRASCTPCSAASTMPIISTTNDTSSTRTREAAARSSDSASEVCSSLARPAVETPIRSAPSAFPPSLTGAP